MLIRPLRAPWDDGFPNVLIHASESAVKQHPNYHAAKAGDVDAAVMLVTSVWSDDVITELVEIGKAYEAPPTLISVHAEEAVGVNAIPEIMADLLGLVLEWPVERSVVQANVVNHTGADGFSRLARQAIFEGAIVSERSYFIVDDFIGQGGTIANLRGHLISQGGIAIGATVLTGKDFSAILSLVASQIEFPDAETV